MTSCFNQYSKCSIFVSTYLYKSSSHWSIILHYSFFLMITDWCHAYFWVHLCFSHTGLRNTPDASPTNPIDICVQFGIISVHFCTPFPALLRLSVFLLSYCIFIWSVMAASRHLSISQTYRSDKPLNFTCRYNIPVLTITTTELRLSASAGRMLHLNPPHPSALLFPCFASPSPLHSFFALTEKRRSVCCPL